MRAKLTWTDIVMLVVWLLPLAYFVYVLILNYPTTFPCTST